MPQGQLLQLLQPLEIYICLAMGMGTEHCKLRVRVYLPPPPTMTIVCFWALMWIVDRGTMIDCYVTARESMRLVECNEAGKLVQVTIRVDSDAREEETDRGSQPFYRVPNV